jgi:energy-coupling factor transporter ATP-binding protein EcfA2
MDLVNIINTPFENEIIECEYYPRNIKSIIKSILINKEHLDFKDTTMTVNKLNKLMKSLKYDSKNDRYILMSLYKNKHNIGRYYQSGVGLQNLPSKIRNTIIDDNYIDFDMKNCAPTTVLHIAKYYKISTDILQDYVKNRQNYINEIMNIYSVKKKAAKTLMTSLLFCGNFKNWLIENGTDCTIPDPVWINDFVKEIDTITTFLYNKEELQIIKEIMKTKRKDCLDINYHKNNKKGSFLSLMTQIIENNVLMSARQFIKKNYSNVYSHTLIFDGFLLWCENKKDLQDIKDAINKHVFNEYGIPIEFEFKDFSDNYKTIISELDKNQEDGCSNEYDVYEKILNYYNEYVIVENKLYAFDGGLWVDGLEVFFKKFEELKEQLYFKPKNEKNIKECNWFYDGAKNSSFHKYIKLNWRSLFNEYVDDKYFIENRNNHLGCLLFNNGTLITHTDKDGKKSLLFEDKFYNNKIFTHKYNVDYIKPSSNNIICNCNDDDIEYIKEVFFGIYGKYKDILIEQLAVSYFGIPTKSFVFVVGDTNVGKSTLISMIRTSLGNEYVGEFDINNFEISGKNANMFDALKYKWILPIADKRLVFCSEGSEKILDSELMKRFTSGGKDAFIARGLMKNEQSVILNALPLCFCNSVPRIQGIDDAIKSRLKVIEIYKKFVKEVADESIECKFIDDLEIMNIISSLKYQDAFRHLLIGYYEKYLENGGFMEQKEDLKQSLNDNLELNVEDEDVEIVEKIRSGLQITGDLDDYIFTSSFNNYLESINLGWIVKKKKITYYLKKICDGKQYKKTNSKYNKDTKTGKYAWLGFKFIDNIITHIDNHEYDN